MPRIKSYRVHCDSCQAVAINGVGCHERGCPESWRQPWGDNDPYPAPCWKCGFDFLPEERPHKYSVCPDCMEARS